jgi:hypothetical protein
MRYAPGAICLLALCLASVAEANQNFTVVLHARIPSGTGTCTVAGLPDCLPPPGGIDPVTLVVPGEFRLFIFVNNYSELLAFQTAFAWPADWMSTPIGEPPITFGCRGTTQAYAHEPVNPGGPTDGTLATAFDCFTGPGLAAIGRIDFLAGAAGCLTQVNPEQGSMKVEVLDCSNGSTTIDASTVEGQLRLGSICVGAPGVNACQPLPVEPATWGKIKNSYR